jgi:hypothetical protein
MQASLQFNSVNSYPVGDITRLMLIRKELGEMDSRQGRLDIMDSCMHLEECITDLIDRLDEYLNYDPTPDYSGEPPLTSAEMHSAAWEQHRAMHS